VAYCMLNAESREGDSALVALPIAFTVHNIATVIFGYFGSQGSFTCSTMRADKEVGTMHVPLNSASASQSPSQLAG
jgi:hypothetical protein